MSTKFSYNKKLWIFVFLHKPQSLFYNILIVCSGETLIRRNNKISIRSVKLMLTGYRIEIFIFNLFRGSKNSFYLSLKAIKKRPSFIELAFCFTKLCRSNQIHCIGNFLRIFYTFNSVFNFLCGCHYITVPAKNLLLCG